MSSELINARRQLKSLYRTLLTDDRIVVWCSKDGETQASAILDNESNTVLVAFENGSSLTGAEVKNFSSLGKESSLLL